MSWLYDHRVYLNDSPRVSLAVAEMRHKEIQKDCSRFRRNVEQVGMFLAYELERNYQQHFGLREVEIPTVNGKARHYLRGTKPLLVNILRAGNPMVEGSAVVFPNSAEAFVDVKRKEGTYHDGVMDTIVNYMKLPDHIKSLSNLTLVIPDIMLATGSSLLDGLAALTDKYHSQPQQIFVNAVIAAKPGVERILKELPNCILHVAAIDPELDSRGYIVPGLGDAGDLCYNGGKSPLEILLGF